jgi:hypothetical protein
VVDQLRAAIHQRLPRADDGHVGLGIFAPVLERVQQLRIEACQAAQVLGICLVGLSLVGVDESQFASVGHQHLVAQLLEHPARPGRVGAGLDGYAHRRPLGGEASPEGFGAGTQPTLFDHLAALLIDEAQVGVFVAYVQSGCRPWFVPANIHGGPILLP